MKVSDKALFNTVCQALDKLNIDQLNLLTPLDLFKLFVTDEIVDMIVTETNRYADILLETQKLQKNSRLKQWQPTTNAEMLSFFEVLIAMGLVQLPKINLYWSKDPLYHNKFISSVITRDRFLLIFKCWHLTPSSINARN